jgi:hypothetical protein
MANRFHAWKRRCASEKTVCLGHAIAGTLPDADRVNVRASKGSQVFGALGPCLLRCSFVWTDVTRLVFESMIMPTMLGGMECCVLSTVMIEEMTTVYHRLMRSALHSHRTNSASANLHRRTCCSAQAFNRYTTTSTLRCLGTLGMLKERGAPGHQSLCGTETWMGTTHQGGNEKPTGSASCSRYIAK